MKTITKLLLTAAFFLTGIVGANAEVKTNWDPSNAFGTTWNSGTNTLSWEKSWFNGLYTGFAPKAQNNSTPVDLSKYAKIHYNITSLTGTAIDENGAYIDLKFRSTGKDDQTIKLREGANDIIFADYAESIDFSKILEVTITATYATGAADRDPGSAVITEMYLYTDKWVIQHQEQTVYVNALGDALSLSSVVSGSTLVSLASSDGNILYGKADDGSQYGSNQIKSLALDDAMALIAGDNNTSYQFRIIDATDEITTLPDGVTNVYRIKAFKKDGTTPFTGPGWNGGSNFYLQEINWTYNVADGTDTNNASFFAITDVAGKENTYKISAYKQDGTAGYKQTIYNKSEWTFCVVSQTQQQQDENVWVELPTLSFNDYGSASTGYESMTTTGGLSFNSLTGVLTSNGERTYGTFTLELAEAVNLEDLYTFNVKRSGNNEIVNRLKFYDAYGGEINTWNNAKWSNNGLDYFATSAFKNRPVKKLVWELDADKNTSSITLTIMGIEWQKKTISAKKGTDITTLPYKVWDTDGDNDATATGDATPAKNFNQLIDMIYGNQNIGDSKNYVDLTNYKKLIIRGYGIIRLFYNWAQSPESKPIDATSFVNNTTTVKTMELDIPTFMTNNNCTHFHLIGVKGSGNCFVESISVTDGTEVYDYAVFGKGGLKLGSAIEALADANATAIDATGLMVSDSRLKETLTTANPNCLIAANADQLNNDNNVIVNGTCANLVLTDGHPFKAPANFTATAASYTTTINETAKAGTLCLPFEATIPEGVTAYTLAYTSGDKATATAIETISANTPVLLNGSGSATFSGTNAAIVASATNVSGALKGVFETGTVPVDSYVLQNGDEGLGFYKVDSSDPITINPFRAYLTAQSNASRISIVFENESAGIEGIAEQRTEDVSVYDLQGRRVAQPTKGLYIVGGKKVIK